LKVVLAILVLTLSACGFQLRGTAALPFETIYIPNTTGGIALDLKRNIQSGTRTRVVETDKGAQALLDLSGETRFRNILSLSGAGPRARAAARPAREHARA